MWLIPLLDHMHTTDSYSGGIGASSHVSAVCVVGQLLILFRTAIYSLCFMIWHFLLGRILKCNDDMAIRVG